MDAKNLVFNESSKRKVIKSLIEVLPRGRASVFFHDFIIKSINSGNLSRFMVTSEKNYVFRVFEFVTEEKFNCLN